MPEKGGFSSGSRHWRDSRTGSGFRSRGGVPFPTMSLTSLIVGVILAILLYWLVTPVAGLPVVVGVIVALLALLAAATGHLNLPNR